MAAAILAIAGPLLLKLVSLWVNKYLDDKEAKRRFLEWVDYLHSINKISAKTYTSYNDQLERIKKIKESLKS